MASTFDYLFELIKFDMQQIQNYRAAMVSISITIVAASFAISAFVWRKDNELDFRQKKLLLLLPNCCLLAILIVTAYFYFDGVDMSRAALELRQATLTAHLDAKLPLDGKDLYPNPRGYTPQMKSWLEKLPMFLGMALLILKIAIEWAGLRFKSTKQATTPAGIRG